MLTTGYTVPRWSRCFPQDRCPALSKKAISWIPVELERLYAATFRMCMPYPIRGSIYNARRIRTLEVDRFPDIYCRILHRPLDPNLLMNVRHNHDEISVDLSRLLNP